MSVLFTRTLILIAITASMALPLAAQQQRQDPLARLRFLSGRWLNHTDSETQEESWSPVLGGSMTGSFRVIQNGQAVFYEFWAVESEHEQPVLKLKHFNAGLIGWEEKKASVVLPLVHAAENDVLFSAADETVSLHYRRSGIQLTCTVHHVVSGKVSDETFLLFKAPLTP